MLGGNGWRLMMGLAVAPALLVWFIRRHVPEPAEITETIAARRTRSERGQAVDQDRFVLRRLLSPPLLRRTLVWTALATGSLIAFWSVSTWYPQIIRQAAAAASLSPEVANGRVAVASMLFNAGGILGYATWGFLADAIGRRKAFAISFAVSAVSVAYLFPFARTYTEFLVVMPDRRVRAVRGVVRDILVYGPELFPPSVRATGIALYNSVGRYITACGPLVAGVHRRFLVRRGPRAGHHLRRRRRDARRAGAAVRPRDPRRGPADRPGRHDHHHRHDHRGGTGMSRYDGATAAVIGGSIGGLTTALLLRDLGFSVQVFERTPTALDGRGGGIVLQPDTVRWFTERSSQQPQSLHTSTDWVQYLDTDNNVIDRDQRTWTYTSWGTFYRALLADFGTADYHLGEFACGFDQDERGATVRFVSGRTSHRGPRRLRRRHHLDGPRAPRPDRAARPTPATSAGAGPSPSTSSPTAPASCSATPSPTASCRTPTSRSTRSRASPAPDAAGRPGDRLMNYVWYRNVPAGPELSEMLIDKRGIPGKVSLHPGQVQDRYVDEMRAAAARMLAPAAAEVVTATATPYVQVVQDVRSSRMADGRVALIGDAACGARPHAAAGTAKAAADAWALSRRSGGGRRRHRGGPAQVGARRSWS